jgi:hypothetical protein
MKFRISSLVVTALSFVLPMAAQVGGTGTVKRIPLWTGSTTLGNSVLFQSGGNVGVGNTAPVAMLDVTGKTGTGGVNNGNAPTALQVIGGLGASNAFFGSVGGPIQAISGGGGRAGGGAVGGTVAMFLMTGAGGAHCRPERRNNFAL